MKWKFIFLLFAGWATLTVGLFLGSLSGMAAEQIGLSDDVRLLIQGVVMSGIVVPGILYLYQHVYRLAGVKPKKPVYSWKRAYHFLTGIILASALAALGLIIAIFQGWIVIEQWHAPNYWLLALLINAIIAFLYEALPEELALRGMLFDLLRHRFAAWLAVLLQPLLFLSVPLAVTSLQTLFGLAPGNIINIPYIVLILCFGICLQLLRLWTGSLWAAIGFHLGYLEITRFVVMADAYGAPPVITYNDNVHGLGGVFVSLGMVIIGGIVVSLIVLGTKRFIRKGKT